MTINPVGTYNDPDFETQDPTTYKTNIDNSILVGKRFADAFACHENETGSPPAANMSVVIDAGFIWDGVNLIEVSEQIIGDDSGEIIIAPSGDPRIDRIVLDRITGVAERVGGSESGSPVPPDIPAGKMPCAQILLDNSPATTEITNQIISDERVLAVPHKPIIASFNKDLGTGSTSGQVVGGTLLADTLITAGKHALRISARGVKTGGTATGTLELRIDGNVVCTIVTENTTQSFFSFDLYIWKSVTVGQGEFNSVLLGAVSDNSLAVGTDTLSGAMGHNIDFLVDWTSDVIIELFCSSKNTNDSINQGMLVVELIIDTP